MKSFNFFSTPATKTIKAGESSIRTKRKRLHCLLTLIFLIPPAIFLSARSITAALSQSGYDPFIRTPAYAPGYSVSKKIASEFLTYPFELIRWPLNKTLVFLEEKRVVAKTRHALRKLRDHGITPRIGFNEWGAELNLPKALKLDSLLPPEIHSKSWAYYSPERIFDTGTKLRLDPTDENGFHAQSEFQYVNRPEEDFYGLGPNTSKGDEANYEMQTLSVKSLAGYSPSFAYRLDAFFMYQNVDISNNHDNESISSLFPDRSIYGLDKEHLITVGTEAAWSPGRSGNPMSSASPGIKISADYNEGLHDSRARYFKFLTELSKSFELGSPLRVFSARFRGEHHNALSGHEVPFHQMARLGGFGSYPFLSKTLRSFDENRFYGETAALFNLEYRYRVYEYREWTLSHVLFFDQGQTFHQLKQFQYGHFRESYGTGFRLAFLQRVLVDIELAHGDEGSAVHFKNRQPF